MEGIFRGSKSFQLANVHFPSLFISSWHSYISSVNWPTTFVCLIAQKQRADGECHMTSPRFISTPTKYLKLNTQKQCDVFNIFLNMFNHVFATKKKKRLTCAFVDYWAVSPVISRWLWLHLYRTGNSRIKTFYIQSYFRRTENSINMYADWNWVSPLDVHLEILGNVIYIFPFPLQTL